VKDAPVTDKSRSVTGMALGFG